MSDFAARIGRLQGELRESDVDGIVLAGTDQMLYLTGWKEGGHERFVGLFLPAMGDAVLLVPAMNAEQARNTPAGITQVVGWDDAAGWTSAAREILADWKSSKTILVDDELHSVHLLDLQILLPASQFAAAGEMMCRLREVKTAEELASMGRAADLIDDVFEEVAGNLKSGITELDVADLVLAAIKSRGSRPSFSPLICFGPNAAMPHHHTGTRKLQSGDVVIIDIGCTADGYASDITRTVSFGQPSDPAIRRIYELVHRAHTAARGAARPGVSGEEVDAAARSVITDAGYGEQFLHRTGHGIGLSVHEPRNIVKGNTAPLKAGNCFSVEPGVYLSGRFGVRIENIVTVTDTGVRSFNAEPDASIRVVSERS